jgi:hypothetical protein
MKAYYAHCKSLYGTAQEKRDMFLIASLGFEVVNPSAQEWQQLWQEKGMDAKEDFAKMCDVIIFRALPQGAISAGVFKEIEAFQKFSKPVLELPSMISTRELTLEQTREYLHEVGQR